MKQYLLRSGYSIPMDASRADLEAFILRLEQERAKEEEQEQEDAAEEEGEEEEEIVPGGCDKCGTHPAGEHFCGMVMCQSCVDSDFNGCWG